MNQPLNYVNYSVRLSWAGRRVDIIFQGPREASREFTKRRNSKDSELQRIEFIERRVKGSVLQEKVLIFSSFGV